MLNQWLERLPDTKTGGVGVPIRKGHLSALKGELLAAEFPAEIKDG